MTYESGLLFFLVSFAAGAINSVAGGGTFLTFPVFIMGGLTSLQANIMSTIALWPGVLASAYGYKSALGEHKKRLLPLLCIGLLGGGCGAMLLLSTPESVFSALVPWLLLAATLVFTFGHHVIRWIGVPKAGDGLHWLIYFGMMITAIYGGYFGAGIGILTLAMLQLMGMHHIHEMNALKTFITGAINAISVLIFIGSGQVLWGHAGVMIAGGIAGGYTGARLALKISPQKLRFLVSLIAFSMTLYFFVKKD